MRRNSLFKEYVLPALIVTLFVIGGLFALKAFLDTHPDFGNKSLTNDLLEEEGNAQEQQAEKVCFLTLIDDSGSNSFTEKLLPVMTEKNVPISMAIETARVGTGDYMSWKTIAENHAAGAEVLNHGRLYDPNAEKTKTRDDDEIREEMQIALQDLIDHGYFFTADIYVYPGSTAGSTWRIARENYRVGINNSGNVVNTVPFNLFNLRRYAVGYNHVPDFQEMKGYIDDVLESGGWEIWMMNSRKKTMTEDYLEALREAIDYCKENGVQIVTAKYVLDYYDVQ